MNSNVRLLFYLATSLFLILDVTLFFLSSGLLLSLVLCVWCASFENNSITKNSWLLFLLAIESLLLPHPELFLALCLIMVYTVSILHTSIALEKGAPFLALVLITLLNLGSSGLPLLYALIPLFAMLGITTWLSLIYTG